MKNKIKNFQRGFAPLLVVAIVAVLAIGGGVYVSKKNAEKKAQIEDNLNTQANANADANANANANLGTNNTKSSLRSLLALGKSTSCTFTSTSEGITLAGTVYVSQDGNMRGDFQSTASGSTTTSHMIWKDGYSYVWSGTQGAKMAVSSSNTGAAASGGASQSFDIDQQVDYQCTDWTADTTKFALPSGVNFVDVATSLKSSTQGDIKITPPNNAPSIY